MTSDSHILGLSSIVLCLWLGACATVPPPPPPTISFEQKMAWILQMEDQRILDLPAPAAPVVVQPKRRNAPPPPAPVAPDLTKLTSDNDTRMRRRAALAIGRVGLKEGIPSLSALLADADADVRQAAAFALGSHRRSVCESGADSAALGSRATGPRSGRGGARLD